MLQFKWWVSSVMIRNLIVFYFGPYCNDIGRQRGCVIRTLGLESENQSFNFHPDHRLGFVTLR